MSPKTTVIRHFFTILAISKTEWRMQVRSRSFWLVISSAIALSLADALTWDRFPSATPLAQSVDLSSDLLTRVVVWMLVFVCAPIFFRDEASGAGELLWATPVPAAQYVTGKFLAALALGLSLFLGVETSAWVTVQIGLDVPFYASLPWHLAVRLALLLPTLFLVVSVNLFLAVLVGRVRLFLLAGSLLWLGWTGFLLPSSMLRPDNFIPVGVFYSSVLGLGPDGALVVANRVLWSGAALVLFVLVIALYARRERRVRLHPHSAWKLGLIGVAGLVLTVGGWARLEHVADCLQPDPLPARLLQVDSTSGYLAQSYAGGKSTPVANPPLPDWSAVQVLTVTVDVSLTPDDGYIQGETTFSLHYEGKKTLEKVPLLLNSGLGVEYVLECETQKQVAFTCDGLELALQPPVPLESGSTWSIKIFYKGRPKTPRVAYRDLDACLGRVAPAKSYLGPDAVFLMRDGDWYPWPLSLSARREATGRLTVHLPPGRQTFHTGRELTDGELVWSGYWPAPLVASYPANKLYRLDVAGGQAYLADLGDTVAREEASDYAAAYTGLSHWLGIKPPSVTLVQVPLVLQPVAASNSSDRDILFIPEGTAFVNRQRDDWTGARVEGDRLDRRRTRAREAATAWWSARLDFPSPRYLSVCPFTNTDCRTEPGCTLQEFPSDAFLDLLSTVSAGTWLGTTGQVIDHVAEAMLLNRVFDRDAFTMASQVGAEQWNQKVKQTVQAEKELARRGILPVLAVSYRTIETSPDSLDLLEAWIRLGDKELGKILGDWLDAHLESQADVHDLLTRLDQ